jgi:hypothetical protein
MSIFLFILLPLCWATLGKALGWALAAAFFYGAAGRRLGRHLSRWGTPILPCLYLVAILTGIDGDAGHGFTLFGSTTLLGLAAAVPFYGVIALSLFAGAVYVLRDLTVGHVANATDAKS